MTATVSCRDVGYTYGGYEALSDIHLDVAPGEIVALSGMNGAGKTTLLEILLGLRKPATGTVRVLGRDPWRHRRHLARGIGAVFQESGCAPDLTVAETVRMWLRLHRRGGEGAALVAEMNLSHRAGVRVRQLSGGERRRLDLAVALTGEPSLLILDEPGSGLDPDARTLMWRVLDERRRAGAAVLVSTHLLDEAGTYADRVESVVP